MAPASASAASAAASGGRGTASDQRGGVQPSIRLLARAATASGICHRVQLAIGPVAAVVAGVAEQDHAGGVAHHEHDLVADLRCSGRVDDITRLDERGKLHRGTLEHDTGRRGAIVQANDVQLDGRHDAANAHDLPRPRGEVCEGDIRGGRRRRAGGGPAVGPRGGRARRRPARARDGSRTRPHWTCPGRGRAPSAARSRIADRLPSDTVV